MKTKLLALLFLAGTALFAGPRVVVGVGFGVGGGYGGGYYAPPPAIAYVPPSPGPGYNWVAGYWYPGHRNWRPGYWAAPVYRPGFYGRAYVGPRYYRRWR